MNFFDRIMMAFMLRKEPNFPAGIVVAVLFFLGGIGLIVYGFKSDYIEWALVGAILALIFAITAAVLIVINILRNSNRW